MKLTRRTFLIGGGLAAGGLVIGISLRDELPVPGLREGTFSPNALLQITPDNEVIFQMARAEMGQGVYHGMTSLIGEDLDFDPARITVELAGVHPEFELGMMGQVTGGSMSIAMGWVPMREAGAMARAMLIEAASVRWGISTDQIDTDNGVVKNTVTGEELDYGSLVNEARQVDENIPFELKAGNEYRWIGRGTGRNDSFIKSTGKAKFGIDVELQGLKTAVVVRPPQFGSRVKSWNADVAEESPGVVRAFEIYSGIAVIANSYWEAHKAAKSLKIEWQDGPLQGLSSESILQAQRRALSSDEGSTTTNQGDFSEAIADAAAILEAEYTAPFLPHNTMEPQNATALVKGESIEMWVPSQAPDMVRGVVAHFTGFKPGDVTVHSTFLGGGFGRRAFVDFAGEAAVIAKQLPGTPVKVIWSREDDIQHDYYRPSSVHGIKAGLDERGSLHAWQHKVVSSSIIKGMAPDMASTFLPAFIPGDMARTLGRYAGKLMAGLDPTISEGAEIPYSVANLQVTQVLSEQGIPVGFWRSVGHSHTAFVAESFMDEMANLAGTDTLEFRRRHLQERPELLAVLNMVAEKAGWGDAPNGRHQGLAMHESFGSLVAMVVEITVTGKRYRVERIVAAIDCGLAVNPDIVRTQVQSAIVYGLSSTMYQPVTIENGAVQQSNFHDAPVLRITESPELEVHIVESDKPPAGVGEPGLPPVAPALANALFAATGQRLRDLPLKLG